MWRCLSGALLGIFGGFVVMGLVVLLIILLFVDTAKAHDVIDVHVSNRTPIVVEDIHRNSAMEDMYFIFRSDEHIPVYYSVDIETRNDWCADSNAYLRALKDLVDEEVAAHPEFTDIYQVSYDSINRAWCK